MAGLTSHDVPVFLAALQGDRPKLGYSDVCNWLPAVGYTSSSRLVSERQTHMTTWQTASREYLHVADLPFQPWKHRLTSCSAIPQPLQPLWGQFKQESSTKPFSTAALWPAEREDGYDTKENPQAHFMDDSPQAKKPLHTDRNGSVQFWLLLGKLGVHGEGEDASNCAGKQENVDTAP